MIIQFIFSQQKAGEYALSTYYIKSLKVRRTECNSEVKSE